MIIIILEKNDLNRFQSLSQNNQGRRENLLIVETGLPTKPEVLDLILIKMQILSFDPKN